MRLGYSQFGQCTLKVDCLEKELRLSIPVSYMGAPQMAPKRMLKAEAGMGVRCAIKASAE